MNRQKVSKKSIKYWIIKTILDIPLYIVINGCLYGAIRFWKWNEVILLISIILSFAIFLFELLIIDINRYKNTYYSINENYIIIEKGKFIKKKTFILIKQIKYITIINSPLLKRYKLSNIVFATGASSHEIEGLDYVVANEIKDNLLSLIEVR